MGCCFYEEREHLFEGLEPGCQFPDVATSEFNGKTYCDFHLPMADKQDIPSDKAAWSEEDIAAFNEQVFDIIGTTAEGAPVDLAGVVFPGFVEFTTIEAFPNVSFQSAAFSEGASFYAATFSGAVDFRAVSLSEDVFFAEATFIKEAYFGDAVFSGSAFFGDAAFRGHASFSGATFDRFATFYRAAFGGSAVFRDAAFSGSAYFSEVAFSGETYFGAATFIGDADFTGSDGEAGTSFSICHFEQARFFGEADFSDRIFKKRTSFKNALFNFAPKFHSSELHQATTFPGAKNFQDTHSDHAAAAYRTLKLAMSDVHAYREQQMFYALEQESARRQMKWWSLDWVMSILYAVSSNYGQRASWPLIWLGVINLGCAGLYKLLGVTDPLLFAGQQVLRPFGIWGKVGAKNFDIPVQILAFTSLQSIISLALFTLFLLAVRRRFKLQ